MATGSNIEAVRAAFGAAVCSGPDGVTEMFGRVATRATATYEPGEVIDGGDRIVVVGPARITPKATGKRFDVRELHVWQVRLGRLIGVEVFLNAPAPLLAALDA